MQQDGCQGAETVAGGWLDAKPSCIAGGFAALQEKKKKKKKVGYFKRQLHLWLVFPSHVRPAAANVWPCPGLHRFDL